MKRYIFLNGRGVDLCIRIGQAFSEEGLVSRENNYNGYYLLYDSERPTSDVVFLKRVCGKWTLLGSEAIDLVGPQQLGLYSMGLTHLVERSRRSILTVIDTSFIEGYFGYIKKSVKKVGRWLVPLLEKSV